MSENEITQELLKEHFEYRDGHLWWAKPTAKRVRVGQQFGSKWLAQYTHKGKIYYLGLYETEEEAAEAYQKATEHLHKEYANYGQSPWS